MGPGYFYMYYGGSIESFPSGDLGVRCPQLRAVGNGIYTWLNSMGTGSTFSPQARTVIIPL